MDAGRLEALLDRLTARQQATVVTAHGSYEAGHLSAVEFTAVITRIVVTGNARGYALGAALARSLIEQAVRVPQVTPATPSGQHLDEVRVAGAVGTVLATDGDTLMRLQRLAGNEPQQAAVDGQQDVLGASDLVDGYIRDLESDSCGLCKWWASESYKFRAGAKFPRHTNCRCGMTPIINEGAKNE